MRAELAGRFGGHMAWKPRDGQDYLYRRSGRVEKSLGPRSAETESIHAAFTAGKTAAARALPDGFIALLRRVDRSFAPLAQGHFSAVNDSGLMVDLITAAPKQRLRLGAPAPDDLTAVEVPRLELLVDAPRFASIAIAEDGLPFWIAAADPRWWAAHKLWLARAPDRDPLKRQRDREQALAVAAMLATAWRETDLSDRALAAIPAALREDLRATIAEAAAAAEAPEW